MPCTRSSCSSNFTFCSNNSVSDQTRFLKHISIFEGFLDFVGDLVRQTPPHTFFLDLVWQTSPQTFFVCQTCRQSRFTFGWTVNGIYLYLFICQTRKRQTMWSFTGRLTWVYRTSSRLLSRSNDFNERCVPTLSYILDLISEIKIGVSI